MVGEERESGISSQEMLKTERYVWIARAFSAVAVLSIVANLLLFASLFSLYPLVRVQHFFLKVYDKNQQIVDLLPPAKNEFDIENALKSLVRQYVLSIYTVTEDHEELAERWHPDGPISLMTRPMLFEDLRKKRYERIIDKLKNGYTSTVKIETISAEDSEYKLWRVKMKFLSWAEQNAREQTEEELEEMLLVSLDPSFGDIGREVRWSERLKNPLGFRVLEYGTPNNKK